MLKRLARGDQGINPLDASCREHDIAYSSRKDLEGRHEADRALAGRARERVFANDATFGEKADATGVWTVMKAKTKLGMGVRRRRRGERRRTTGRKRKSRGQRRRVLPIAKRGGFLPLLLPALSAIGALAGGAAGITKAVNDAKAARKQLEETLRHNRAMEGRGMYLAPYKRGAGMNLRRRRRPRKKKTPFDRACGDNATSAAATTTYDEPAIRARVHRRTVLSRGVYARHAPRARTSERMRYRESGRESRRRHALGCIRETRIARAVLRQFREFATSRGTNRLFRTGNDNHDHDQVQSRSLSTFRSDQLRPLVRTISASKSSGILA